MAKVLMGIVSIFLVFNSFRIFLNFYEAVYEINPMGNDEPREPIKSKKWFSYASVISNLFISLNACCNLIIYCALNNQFRNHFFEVVPFCNIPFVRSGPENIPLEATHIETQAILITENATNSPIIKPAETTGANGIQNMKASETSKNINNSRKSNDTNGTEAFV